MINIKVGDIVERRLAGIVPMKLRVTEVTDSVIVCGAWSFDRATGAEIDEFLGWGPPPLSTGSVLNMAEPTRFCKYCGASIPHRYGEGRCSKCMHHLPSDGN